MENTIKNILYAITAFIDISLIIILTLYKFSLFDKLWIFSVIISHALFYYALTFYNKTIIDILHYFVFILPIISIFANNIFIKILSLSLIIIIQILWIKENRCILNEPDESWGYGKELNYSMLLFTGLLSINIGLSFKK